MKPKNALPFILALGMTAGSTAVYAQTLDAGATADVTATTDIDSGSVDAATSTDATTQACADGEACADTTASADTMTSDEDAMSTADADAAVTPLDETEGDVSATADAGAPLDPMTGDDAAATAQADGEAITPLGSADADADLAMEADSMDAAPVLSDVASVADTAELVGARAYDSNEEWIGEVSAVIPAEGEITEEQFVIDVGGFLGIGEKPVAITAGSLQVQLDEDGGVDHVVVGHTMTELEQMPEVEM